MLSYSKIKLKSMKLLKDKVIHINYLKILSEALCKLIHAHNDFCKLPYLRSNRTFCLFSLDEGSCNITSAGNNSCEFSLSDDV